MPRKEVYAKHRAASIRYATQWNKEHREARAVITKKYDQSEKGKMASKRYRQGRRASHRNARPPWRDQELIDRIYAFAEQNGLTVDHIIPLRGKTVCGLHVETNLRIITLEENQAKSSKLLDELPAPVNWALIFGW